MRARALWALLALGACGLERDPTPLALAIPALAPLLGRRPGRMQEALVLATLAFPFVGVMIFIHPAQGLFRDWDDFAATGAALSLVTAWLVGETLRDSRRFAWLAVTVTLGVGVAAIQWLVVHTGDVRGLARVRRHRLVYDALASLMPQGIHALAIDARTPDER